jgi:hypothetical protein
MTLTTLLIVAATVLSLYALIESRGRGILAWACFLLALAFCLPILK